MRALASGYVNWKELLLRIIRTKENYEKRGGTDGRGAGGDFTIMPLETDNMRGRVDHGLRNTF